MIPAAGFTARAPVPVRPLDASAFSALPDDVLARAEALGASAPEASYRAPTVLVGDATAGRPDTPPLGVALPVSEVAAGRPLPRLGTSAFRGREIIPLPTPEPVVARVTPLQTGGSQPQPRPAPAPPSSGPSGGGGWRVTQASWYGPGFYGRRTACGQEYTRTIVGVAHRTLPCGTRIQFRWKGQIVVAPVIDRGPYGVAGRDFDLSAALACDILNRCYTASIEYRIL